MDCLLQLLSRSHLATRSIRKDFIKNKRIGSTVWFASSYMMAWRTSGSTNTALIEGLCSYNIVKDDRIKTAMLHVDRGHYAPSSPYQDSPQSIGHGATISAPHMHAAACESLLSFLRPGSRVLDVGSGSGYLSHVLAELVKPDGLVIGIEHIQPLVDLSVRNAQKSAGGRDMLDTGLMRFVKGDGRQGWNEGAPYDAIHVGAAAKAVHPQLLEQLKAPGRLFIPVEEGLDQHIYVIDKDAQGEISKKKSFGVRYVPLTDEPTS